MLSVNGIRNACPKCYALSFRCINQSSKLRPRNSFTQPYKATAYDPSRLRSFSTFPRLRQEETPVAASAELSDVEKVVRDAKQRFRDTLPKGYLNEEEYALYERMYGPPLRETTPEDVGIPSHMNLEAETSRSENEGTLLKELDGGIFEEVSYELPASGRQQPDEIDIDAETADGEQEMVTRAPGYIEAIARNQREHDAMQRLRQDFEAAQRRQEEEDEAAAAAAAEEEAATDTFDASEESLWAPEPDIRQDGRDEFAAEELAMEARRYHPYTLEGRFHDSPVEILLPRDELVTPLRDLLDRSHPRHVQEAAEAAFGGRGLPTSPATPPEKRNGQMGGVGLSPTQKHMTEIEADAFLAAFVPPAYASALSILREVRKRAGSDWLQSKLKEGPDGGLSVLDVGMGGAALAAWEQVVKAEWDILREKGEVRGAHPPGKRTVVASSDRLRQRIKSFLHNTTILPRLPDYEHSGQTVSGENLDAGSQPQPRKVYDVIIASHLFLREKQEHYRQAILNNLWTLLNKDGGILIIVEKAHPRGFEAVAHVRQTLLERYLLPQSGKSPVSEEDFNPAYHRELEPGHIIAPCTNHSTCPMYQNPGKSVGRKDYCHFSQRFVRPSFYSEVLGKTRGNQGEVEFSYVAIQRGVPNKDSLQGKEANMKAFEGYEDAPTAPSMLSLPRVLIPPLKRKGHVTLDLCTTEGKIERWTVPKSYSKLAYHDARKARWGDLWALGAKTRVLRNIRIGRAADEHSKGPSDVRKARATDASGAEIGQRTKDKVVKNKKREKRDLMDDIFEEEERDEEDVDDAYLDDLEDELAEDLKKFQRRQ